MHSQARSCDTIVVLISALITVGTAGCSTRGVDSFFVDKAALVELKTHDSMRLPGSLERSGAIGKELVLSGHRITSGEGMVIAYREFSSGLVFRADQAQFAKLTVFLPFLVHEKEMFLNLSEQKNIIAYWSKGSSNFPGKSGCHGYTSGGTIRLTKKDQDQFLVELSLQFNLVSPGGWKKECGLFDFNDPLILKEINLPNLTPWEGKRGEHIYDESMR